MATATALQRPARPAACTPCRACPSTLCQQIADGCLTAGRSYADGPVGAAVAAAHAGAGALAEEVDAAVAAGDMQGVEAARRRLLELQVVAGSGSLPAGRAG